MRRYFQSFLMTGFLLLLGSIVWFWMNGHAEEMRGWLIALKHYCVNYPWTGYVVYGALLSTIVLVGLPAVGASMLLAGVIYNDFWEATALVTLSRLLVAFAAFLAVRQLIGIAPAGVESRKPSFLRRFEKHPNLGLLVARLVPIPDSMVNYTVAVSSIRQRDYIVVSLIGMLPFTILCIWLGRELGSVTSLMHVMK